MGARVLIATAEAWLVEVLLRLVAAVGARSAVAGTADEARALWRHPEIVLVGADLADALSGVPRRPSVVLVCDTVTADPYRRAVQVGAQHVAALPDSERALIGLLSERPARGDPARIVCCVGGRGGAGATSLAAVLALTSARRGGRTLLLDADPLGGGVDLALGVEGAGGARWPELAGGDGRLDPEALRRALPTVGELAVLAWGREQREPVSPGALRAVLEAAERSHALVVVDLPRSLDGAAVPLGMAAETLLVVPLEVRAVAAAGQVAAGLLRYTTGVRLVVRPPSPGGLSSGDVAAALELPLAGEAPYDRGLAGALERGAPHRARRLAGFCGRLLDELEGGP